MSIDREDYYEFHESRAELADPGERLGYHKSCGGAVYERRYSGKSPSLNDPGEPGSSEWICGDCGEECDEGEICATDEEALSEEPEEE